MKLHFIQVDAKKLAFLPDCNCSEVLHICAGRFAMTPLRMLRCYSNIYVSQPDRTER